MALASSWTSFKRNHFLKRAFVGWVTGSRPRHMPSSPKVSAEFVKKM